MSSNNKDNSENPPSDTTSADAERRRPNLVVNIPSLAEVVARSRAANAAALPSPRTPQATDVDRQPPVFDEKSLRTLPDTTPVPFDPLSTSGKLSSGMRFIVKEHKLPPGTVEIRLIVHVGSVHEEAHEHGLAHLVEHLVFRETELFPDHELSRTFAQWGATPGADTNAATAFLYTTYRFSVPSVALPVAMFVASEMLFRALFSDEVVANELSVVYTELMSGDQIGPMMYSSLYEGTGYERPVGGSAAELVAALNEPASKTTERARAFYKKWYRPENMTCIVVGDLEPEHMMHVLAFVLGHAGEGCSQCGKMPAKKCSQCRCVRYCSAACQHGHWPEHKKRCERIAVLNDLMEMHARPTAHAPLPVPAPVILATPLRDEMRVKLAIEKHLSTGITVAIRLADTTGFALSHIAHHRSFVPALALAGARLSANLRRRMEMSSDGPAEERVKLGQSDVHVRDDMCGKYVLFVTVAIEGQAIVPLVRIVLEELLRLTKPLGDDERRSLLPTLLSQENWKLKAISAIRSEGFADTMASQIAKQIASDPNFFQSIDPILISKIALAGLSSVADDDGSSTSAPHHYLAFDMRKDAKVFVFARESDAVAQGVTKQTIEELIDSVASGTTSLVDLGAVTAGADSPAGAPGSAGLGPASLLPPPPPISINFDTVRPGMVVSERAAEKLGLHELIVANGLTIRLRIVPKGPPFAAIFLIPTKAQATVPCFVALSACLYALSKSKSGLFGHSRADVVTSRYPLSEFYVCPMGSDHLPPGLAAGGASLDVLLTGTLEWWRNVSSMSVTERDREAVAAEVQELLSGDVVGACSLASTNKDVASVTSDIESVFQHFINTTADCSAEMGALYMQYLLADPSLWTLAIVGNFNVGQATLRAAQTLGNIVPQAQRKAELRKAMLSTHPGAFLDAPFELNACLFPDRPIIRNYYYGVGGTALVEVAMPMRSQLNVDVGAFQRVAAIAIQQKLFETMRERNGSVYSVSVDIEYNDRRLCDHGVLRVRMGVPVQEAKMAASRLVEVLALMRTNTELCFELVDVRAAQAQFVRNSVDDPANASDLASASLFAMRSLESFSYNVSVVAELANKDMDMGTFTGAVQSLLFAEGPVYSCMAVFPARCKPPLLVMSGFVARNKVAVLGTVTTVLAGALALFGWRRRR